MQATVPAELTALLGRLWQGYVADNPQAAAIHALFAGRGEVVENDHIALRTFGDPRIGLGVLARPFLAAGYRPGADYRFPQKGLCARHYDPPAPGLPRVFVSELELGPASVCSPWAQRVIAGLVDAIEPGLFDRDDLTACGRPWPPIAWATYERLAAESEYAAWMAAFGLRANHFTVSVNQLRHSPTLAEVNALIEGIGIPINQAGGAIKGGPAQLLEQSSTLAAPVVVDFAEGPRTIPGCYYEFARRYADRDGRLFAGFIAGSADRIFESTDRR